jgi:hypothetical protein
MRLLFRREERNVAECLVLVLYVAGFGYLAHALLAPLFALGFGWSGKVQMVVAVIWSIRGARGFFGVSWPSAIWRMLVVGVLHMLGTFLFFAAVAIPWFLVTRG